MSTVKCLLPSSTFHFCVLVGGIPTPLKNMKVRTNPSNAPRAAGFPPVAAGRAEASPWMYRADLTGEFRCDFHGKMLGLTWFNHPK